MIWLALLLMVQSPSRDEIADRRDDLQDMLDTYPADSEQAEQLQDQIDELDEAETSDEREEILNDEIEVDEPEDFSY